jgi:hypothetical protein
MRDGFTGAATETAVRTIQDLTDLCERVVQPMAELPLPLRGGPCFACGRLAEYAVTFRSGGEDMAFVNACETHKDVPVTVGVSCY